MPVNAKHIRQAKSPLPTLDDVDKGLATLDEYEVAHAEDIPEWTEKGVAQALPAADIPELHEFFEKARGQRGPQKAPVKERIGLRLDQSVLDHFRESGPGWQSRINDVLIKYVKADEK